jgi:hypothetical protein
LAYKRGEVSSLSQKKSNQPLQLITFFNIYL